jgi:predicted phage baseplate assembly protein
VNDSDPRCGETPTAPPGRRDNEPGRVSIEYRVGDFTRFYEAMVDALGGQPDLVGLTSRAGDEPAVALVGAWASALDVLSFYQERIANEGYVRTATERGSVRQLARAIGYELRPGVAATTWLAFTVIASPGTPSEFPIPAGTRAQSVPGPGELPQSFETVEALDTRPEWNAMPIVAAAPRAPTPGDTTLRLAGTDFALQPGDPLLVVGSDPTMFDVRRVARTEIVDAVFADPLDADPLIPAHTLVTLDAALMVNALEVDLGPGVSVHVLRQRVSLFGYNAPEWPALPLTLRVGDLNPYFIGSSFAGSELMMRSRASGPSGVDTAIDLTGGIADRVTDAGFLDTGDDIERVLVGAYANRASTWAEAVFGSGTTTIHLDQVYPKIIRGSWVVLEGDGAFAARRVGAVAEVPYRDFGMSARVTRLDLTLGSVEGFSPRTTTVLAQSERLPVAVAPLRVGVTDVDTLDLLRPVDLPTGRTVVISGLGPTGEPESEVATIAAVLAPSAAGLGPRIRLAKRITGHYQRQTVKVLGNVAKATHGESRAEVVGSGDQRVPFQSFALSQKPLTYARSTSPSGSRSTLALWVGGVRWREVPSLHGTGPTDRVYVVRHRDDGTAVITTGDGVTGARLPSGRNNVVATYRVGIGRAANLDRGRVSLPMTRPLGLRDVVNPVPADGADDPEDLERARVNAPLAVTTLGRVVSVDDYAAFARAFAGVGKARADVLWAGERPEVVLTVAGTDGAPVGSTSALAVDLAAALDRARHDTVTVRLASYADRRLILAGRLLVAADRRFPDVAAAVQAALLEHFSFARRDFAQPVAQSEVVAAIHAVAGVDAFLLGELRSDVDAPNERLERVRALPARRIGSDTLPADLLTLSATDIDIQEAT